MQEITLKHYDNESHGYGKISKYDLIGFNIPLTSFSDFSFYNTAEACFYLEEDCDLTKLINLLKEKNIKVNFKNEYVNYEYFHNNNEFIRTLPSELGGYIND